MSEVVSIDNEFFRLVFDTDTQIVHHTIKQPVTSDQFRHVLNAGIDVLGHYRANRWLSDDRGNGPISEADTHWALHDWFPRARALGWEYWALVVPPELIARSSLVDHVSAYTQQGIRVMLFTDVKDAKNWLFRH